MKILVTGAKGQLGTDVMCELLSRGHEAVGIDIDEADITDRADIMRAVTETAPQAVIHCAAWTAVDAAEDDPAAARRVNAEGTRNVAKACASVGAKMMYISTDYVFGGKGTQPWKADCRDYAPLNVYGETKLAGELAVAEICDKYFIDPIAWVFGAHGKNFVDTMLKLAETHDRLSVVCDQIGTPTYTSDLARLLADMIVTDKYGYYHATNEGGYISWYDYAREIFAQAGRSVEVVPVTTAEYGLSKAERPLNSRLDRSKLTENGFSPLPDWRDALGRYLAIKHCGQANGRTEIC